MNYIAVFCKITKSFWISEMRALNTGIGFSKFRWDAWEESWTRHILGIGSKWAWVDVRVWCGSLWVGVEGDICGLITVVECLERREEEKREQNRCFPQPHFTASLQKQAQFTTIMKLHTVCILCPIPPSAQLFSLSQHQYRCRPQFAPRVFEMQSGCCT